MDMWENSEQLNDYPYFGDTENYFPTVTSQKSFREAVDIERQKREGKFEFREIMLRHEELSIQDDPFSLKEKRNTNFLNID